MEAEGKECDGEAVKFVAPEVRQPGVLFTWGRGSDGQLGQDEVAFPFKNCAMPHPVRALGSTVVYVACGGGQQGCTMAVTTDGSLYTFGNNYKGRLGHGNSCGHVRSPRRVEGLEGVPIMAVAASSAHALALDRAGRVWSWGRGSSGELGRPGPERPCTDDPLPRRIDDAGLSDAMAVDAECGYSGAVLRDGGLCLWGSNAHGKLGIGMVASRKKSTDAGRRGSGIGPICWRPMRVRPMRVSLAPESCGPMGAGARTHAGAPGIEDDRSSSSSEASEEVFFLSLSLGSLYAGAVTGTGKLYTWGYGGKLCGRTYSTPHLRYFGSHVFHITRAVVCPRWRHTALTLL